MNKFLLILSVLLYMHPANALQIPGRDITIDLYAEVREPLAVKLAYYYGNRVYLQDSMTINPGTTLTCSGHFREGIYLLVFSDSGIYEFMIGEQDRYSVSISRSKGAYRCSIQGDPITMAFDAYNKKTAAILDSIGSLKQEISSKSTAIDKDEAATVIARLTDSLNVVKAGFAERYTGTFLGHYLQAQIPVSFPGYRKRNSLSETDSVSWLMNLHYYRDHFLDNISWNDPRLIFTPVLEEKINEYLDKIVRYDAGSQKNAIDTLMDRSDHRKVRQFIAEVLLSRFGRSKHKPVDEYAYLYLIDTYYLKEDPSWVNEEQLKALKEEYTRLLPVSLHQKAPDLTLPDRNNRPVSLYVADSGFLLLFFWDYSCDHCSRIIRDLALLVSKYSYLDLQVFTVFTGEDTDIWKAYLARKFPGSWIHTRQPENGPKATDTYNVSFIPCIFLLDGNKTIVSKHVTIPELDTYFFQAAGSR
jgi:hypothetical protein